ncbi:MAG: TolC family protein [Parabacteroides sp.]|nr:TolC family protein [Parabacteroides sp.]
MKQKSILLVLALLSYLTGAAQVTNRQLPVAGDQLTLEECQQLAQENYPLLKRYNLIQQTTEYSLQNINRGYLPQLVFSGQATYQSDVATLPELLTNLLAQNGYAVKGLDKDQYRIALDLNQIIWDGGNLKAQKENVTAQGEIQTKQTDVDMYNIRERINNLYFGILLIEDKIRLSQDLQTLLQSNYDKLESMRQNGTAMQADVNAIRAEYLKTNQQLTELTSMRQSFQQMLTLFIGKQVTANTTLLKPNATLPISLENLRPELQMFDAQLQQTEAQRRLLNSEVRPRLSLFAQGFYGYPGYNMFEDMFNHDFSLNGLVGVRLSWNISKLYTHKNDKRKLVLAQNQIENAREVFLFNNQLQSTQEQEAIERYRKMMSEDDEIIRLRTSVRQVAEAKLKHGVIDVNNLLQEITRENQARTNQSSHEIEMLKHIYELRHTVNQ